MLRDGRKEEEKRRETPMVKREEEWKSHKKERERRSRRVMQENLYRRNRLRVFDGEKSVAVPSPRRDPITGLPVCNLR